MSWSWWIVQAMLKLKFPSSCMVTGPSQSGKTELVRKMITEQVYDYDIKKVVWCYSAWQPWFVNEKNLKFVCGFPSNEETFDLLILDDMMNNLTNEIAQMFTVGSHHKNFSIILITQNLFPRAKVMRDISLNTHYIILFRNSRDQSQALCFARQAFPTKSKYFMDAYKKATAKPFSYLMVDVHPRTPDQERLRQSIFPDQGLINWVFVPSEK